jgi:hypothetical protein
LRTVGLELKFLLNETKFVMRPVLLTFFGCLFALASFGQKTDSTNTDHRSTHPNVMIPGVDSPISAPGTLMQSSPNPNQLPPTSDNKRRKTTPPTDPRAFGVAVPLGKTKRDSL